MVREFGTFTLKSGQPAGSPRATLKERLEIVSDLEAIKANKRKIVLDFEAIKANKRENHDSFQWGDGIDLRTGLDSAPANHLPVTTLKKLEKAQLN